MSVTRTAILSTLGAIVISCAPDAVVPDETSSPVGSEVSTSEWVTEMEAYGEHMTRAQDTFDARYQEHIENLSEPSNEYEFLSKTWTGSLEVFSSYAADLAAVRPPAEIAAEHDAYVTSMQAFFSEMEESMAGFTTAEQFHGYYMFESFYEAPKIMENHADALYRLGVACHALIGAIENRADWTETHFCPPSAAVTVEVADEWVTSSDVIRQGGWVDMDIFNNTGEVIQIVVVELSDGDTDDLPIAGGQIVLPEDADPDLQVAVLVVPMDLQPDGGVGVRLEPAGEGRILALDHRPGKFESGAFVSIDLKTSR